MLSMHDNRIWVSDHLCIMDTKGEYGLMSQNSTLCDLTGHGQREEGA